MFAKVKVRAGTAAGEHPGSWQLQLPVTIQALPTQLRPAEQSLLCEHEDTQSPTPLASTYAHACPAAQGFGAAELQVAVPATQIPMLLELINSHDCPDEQELATVALQAVTLAPE